MPRTKHFSCPDCLADFEITVEPTIHQEIVEKEYPESIEWLNNVRDCSVCGNPLEER